MPYYFRIFFLFIILFISGCGNNSQTDKASDDSTAGKKTDAPAASSDRPVAKVYIHETGKITANGTGISLAMLDSNFSRLKADSGIVYYARGNGTGEPTPEAMSVLRLIIKHELPVQLYTDSNFTTVVDLKVK